MARVRVHNFAMPVDGYVARPSQDRDHPLGVGGERLHDWAFATRGLQRMLGNDGGDTGVEDDFWVGSRGDEMSHVDRTMRAAHNGGAGGRGVWDDDRA